MRGGQLSRLCQVEDEAGGGAWLGTKRGGGRDGNPLEIGDIVIGFQAGGEGDFPRFAGVFLEGLQDERSGIESGGQNEVEAFFGRGGPGQESVVEVASEALPFVGFGMAEGREVNLVSRIKETRGRCPGFEPWHAKDDVSRGDTSETKIPHLACFGDEVMGEVIGAASIVGASVPEAGEDVKLTRADGEETVAVNDAFGIEAGETRELAEAFDGGGEQTADGTVAGDGAKAGASSVEKTGSACVDQLPSHKCRKSGFGGKEIWGDLGEDPEGGVIHLSGIDLPGIGSDAKVTFAISELDGGAAERAYAEVTNIGGDRLSISDDGRTCFHQQLAHTA